MLTFELTVEDNDGAIGTDTVDVRVDNGNIPNMPPVADAGPDMKRGYGAPIILGGNSFDPDGRVAAYSWTQLAGPAVVLRNTTTASASFDPPAVLADTTLTFQLAVTDNESVTAVDTVNVTVGNFLDSSVYLGPVLNFLLD